jgi:hypothetical protein
MSAHDEIATGEPARVFSGIRDVPIYAGESSKGSRLPGAPYRSAELIAIGVIVLPALWWFRTHQDSGFPVLAGGVVAAAVVTVILRLLLPKRRPSLAARASFALAAALTRQVCAGKPQTRAGHGRR